MPVRIRVAALALLPSLACAHGGAADRPSDAAAELLAADRAFAAATAERGVEGWVAWFAEDGAMVRGSGEVVGHAAIRAAMGPFLEDPALGLRWEPTRAEVAPGGDLGYTVGTYEIVGRDPATGEVTATLENGMYLTVWRRGADGGWEVVADIGSPAGE